CLDLAAVDLEDRGADVDDAAAGRCDTEQLAVVGAAPGKARYDLVAFGDQLIDLVVPVGERRTHLLYIGFEGVDPGEARPERSSEADVGRDDLVRGGEMPLVPEPVVDPS